MEQVRIQRKRTKGWKMPPNTIYVGRPTIYGNPIKILDDVQSKNGLEWVVSNASDAVMAYKEFLELSPQAPSIEMIKKLKGKNLCCWCSLDKPCHADILLKLANN